VYIIGTVNMDETTHPFSKKEPAAGGENLSFDRIEGNAASELNRVLHDFAAYFRPVSGSD
jgi:hypothetical protein